MTKSKSKFQKKGWNYRRKSNGALIRFKTSKGAHRKGQKLVKSPKISRYKVTKKRHGLVLFPSDGSSSKRKVSSSKKRKPLTTKQKVYLQERRLNMKYSR